MMQGQILSGGEFFVLAVYAIEMNAEIVRVENGEGSLKRVSFRSRFFNDFYLMLRLSIGMTIHFELQKQCKQT